MAHKESIFQPEFPITTDLLQKDYQIEKTIAKGAFGEVYKVKKISEDKDYALKVLSKSQVRLFFYRTFAVLATPFPVKQVIVLQFTAGHNSPRLHRKMCFFYHP